MHHIWFLTIRFRDGFTEGVPPRHQPLDYPRPWRWLIWTGGFLAGGWFNTSLLYEKKLYLPTIRFWFPTKPVFSDWVGWQRPQDRPHFHFIPKKARVLQGYHFYTPAEHFDWVLNAYAPNQTPNQPDDTDDIPF